MRTRPISAWPCAVGLLGVSARATTAGCAGRRRPGPSPTRCSPRRSPSSYEESRRTYGYRRVTSDLNDAKRRAGRAAPGGPADEAGWDPGRDQAKLLPHHAQGRPGPPAPDLMERNFTAAGPDRRWVADITYVPTWAGFLFLAVVLDVFTRQVVGWSMAANQNTELVTRALQMAVRRRRPGGVVSITPTRAVNTRATTSPRPARQRTSRARWDRSATASTTPWPRASSPPWSASCSTAASSRTATWPGWPSSITSNGFYNPTRRHSSVGNLSPLEFERRWRANLISSNAA